MRVLLDTHVWIWCRAEPDRLSGRVRRIIESPRTAVYFSAASAWELAIKSDAGRLRLPESPEQVLSASLEEDRFEELPIRLRHALMTTTLPPLHGDPFDRLLIAQARCERLTLVTADERVLAYGGPVTDARA